jgi:hypothetical protein
MDLFKCAGDVKEFGFWEVCPATESTAEGGEKEDIPDVAKGAKKVHAKHKRCQSTLPAAASNPSHRRLVT